MNWHVENDDLQTSAPKISAGKISAVLLEPICRSYWFNQICQSSNFSVLSNEHGEAPTEQIPNIDSLCRQNQYPSKAKWKTYITRTHKQKEINFIIE